ncbi:MAG: nickel pincer cofactor biosynthesis protein LarB [Candidatus Brocadia sp.]|nr:nickel pincer cofactor biosynthesis protein LarB [Candidatus Brocadia sp.]MCE7910122.1 nickel pincer cofactor biosynthesis protein LarB [Candidatus Brocadia sp. AMX3]MDG5996126.1 nickel pincer cofactor biosynthesis protein LarB [Candidatus Brocadia sp.]RIK03497.1 MAG: nickel pincer cofactor biosynthesis protein LarB [Candidatus Brocadia sp.]
MDIDVIKQLLENYKIGKVPMHDVMEKIRELPYKDIGFAKVDSHRKIRCGFPEVIFCLGKTPEQVVKIAGHIVAGENDMLATRATREMYEAVSREFPEAVYHEQARTITIRKTRRKPHKGLILIITAGTSDIPVAEEARVTAEIMGNTVRVLYDVGVAGIHRLMKNHSELLKANVIIVVAGMEGALASVVGGLVDCPVIGVPTSIGYGASFSGITPLLSMLNSCASGVSVVNIDNGFGAAYAASLINRTKK